MRIRIVRCAIIDSGAEIWSQFRSVAYVREFLPSPETGSVSSRGVCSRMSNTNRRLLGAVLAFLSSAVGLSLYWGPLWFGEVGAAQAITLTSIAWFFSRVIGFSLLAALPFVLIRRSIVVPIIGGAIIGYALSLWYVMSSI